MRVVLDAECDNLLPFVTRIFVVCVLNLDTGEMKSYLEHEAGQFIADAIDWREIITFNGIGYDLPVLWKLWNLSFTVGPDTLNGLPTKHTDCLVQSRTLHPDRNGKKHSLASWGEKLGFRKTDWKDFAEYSEEMEAYCWNDVLLTARVYKALQREMAKE